MTHENINRAGRFGGQKQSLLQGLNRGEYRGQNQTEAQNGAMPANKMPLTRYVGSAALAATLTFGLGVTMALMIQSRFAPQEKLEPQAFQINPEIVDIDLPRRKVTPDIILKVEVPPPSPRIATAQKMQPSVPIAKTLNDPELDLKLPVILGTGPIVKIVDQDEQPLYRAPPVLPRSAERSGHCLMRFNVSAEGSPYDIIAESCSENIFARPSVKAVSKWKYRAKIMNGQRASRTGLTTRITYQLRDERGDIIPE